MNARRWLLPGFVAAVCACGTQTKHDDGTAEHAVAGTAPADHAQPAAAAAPARGPEESGIDPDADTIVRAMCDALRDAKRLSFHAETTMDRLLSNGSWVEVPASMNVALRRPDGLRVDRTSVRGHRVFQYDGKQLGVLDVDKHLFVQGDAPPTVDDTIDSLEQRFDIVLPLADLLAADPYVSFSEEFADDAVRVGTCPYRGKTCDVLAYRNESIDWQVWIAREGPRVPLRLVIRYESEPGIPRFTADLSDWNLSDTTADADFTFSPPADARRIEVAKRNSDEPTAAAGEKR